MAFQNIMDKLKTNKACMTKMKFENKLRERDNFTLTSVIIVFVGRLIM